jgi:hypothetical protein
MGKLAGITHHAAHGLDTTDPIVTPMLLVMMAPPPGSENTFQGFLHLVYQTAGFAHHFASRLKRQFDLPMTAFTMFPIIKSQNRSGRQTSFRQPEGCTPRRESHNGGKKVAWLEAHSLREQPDPQRMRCRREGVYDRQQLRKLRTIFSTSPPSMIGRIELVGRSHYF